MKNVNVMIIGGGIAGPVLAMALKKMGYRVTIFEAQEKVAISKGSWLALMPNGINALKSLGLGHLNSIASLSTGLDFYNHTKKNLGRFDHGVFSKKFGSPALVMKRSDLHQFLHHETAKQEIPVLFNKRLKAIEQKPDGGVLAHFEDNTSYKADILVGCDGIHSKTRAYVLNKAIKPDYTGVVGFGGFSNVALPHAHRGNDLTMTFGKEAFFGYFPANEKETWWYSNIPQKNEPDRNELLTQIEIQSYLASVHQHDPYPISELIKNTHSIDRWVIYDMPELPKWYSDAVVLVGDAAHATAPHGAQGASLAIEDALILSKCMRDIDEKETIFRTYQQLRKLRVERQAKQARKRGNQNLNKNPVAIFARDFFMPIAMKTGLVNEDWLYSYAIDWNTKIIEQNKT